MLSVSNGENFDLTSAHFLYSLFCMLLCSITLVGQDFQVTTGFETVVHLSDL